MLLWVSSGDTQDVEGEKQMSNWKALSDEESRVIVHKGTERAFTGEYYDHHEDGRYHCKRCGAALFESTAKFDSGTGWPSFDDAVEGAVKELPDADGYRTEIVCAACGGHLGHVFRGEGFTDKNTRHCVNSISLSFEEGSSDGAVASSSGPNVSTDAVLKSSCDEQRAYFAGGCFWGVEYYFDKLDGVLRAESGYMGGDQENPSYEEVCGKDTGHAETVEVVYDPKRVDYETLARLFFEIHDPTQVDRQGPDRGPQYRSVLFYQSDEELAVAKRLVAELEAKGFEVATSLEPAATFWRAEGYHQDYYERKGGTPYCHGYVKRF
jgi:peptide methionine sulfoxide reductase msrA/msrB